MDLLPAVIAGIIVFMLHRRLARLEARIARLEPPAPAEVARGPWQRERTSPTASAPVTATTNVALGREPQERPRVDGTQVSSGFEERFARRWLVWLGAATFALGGMFLVRIAADHGLFGPGARLLLALVAGAALAVAGEWLRRRPDTSEAVASGRDFVPPALTAAGMATLFATVWAAYALYGFLPPLMAFAFLAALCVLSFLLSFLHGLFLALIGLAGGMAVPLLVRTGDASAPGLFLYLALILASAFGVLHWMRWKSLFVTAIPALAIWVAFWLVMRTPPPATATIASFLLATACLGHALPLARERFRVTDDHWRRPRLLLGVALVPLWLVLDPFDGGAASSFTWLAAMGALSIAIARFRGYRSIAPLLPLAAIPLALAILDPGQAVWMADGRIVPAPDSWNFEQAILRPADIDGYLRWCLILAGIAAVCGGLFIHGAASPGMMTVIAIFMPVAILAVAWLRLADLGRSEIGWASVAAGIALFGLVLATFASRLGARYRGALAASTAGIAAALALGAVMALEHGWLVTFLVTEALALILVWQRFRMRTALLLAPWLTTAATGLAVVSPQTMGIGDILFTAAKVPSLGAIAIGLVLPAALALAAAWRLGGRGGPVRRVRIAFEGAALLLGLLAIAHLARQMADIAGGGHLVEFGIQIVAWLMLAFGIMRRQGLAGLGGGVAWCLIALAGGLAMALALALNPGLTREPVGVWPLLNALLPAYALPALVLTLFALRSQPPGLARAFGLAALIEAGLWGFWSIRHAFTGSPIAGPMSAGEHYAHSLALVLAAAGLLTGGLHFGSLALRRAGLAVLVLAILKVFLLDLDQLEGVLRAASFMGLGLAMIGAGHAFQRWGRA